MEERPNKPHSVVISYSSIVVQHPEVVAAGQMAISLLANLCVTLVALAVLKVAEIATTFCWPEGKVFFGVVRLIDILDFCDVLTLATLVIFTISSFLKFTVGFLTPFMRTDRK